ncbi:MAG: HNH endonuclease [Gammaproteobacteria bacterium]|nr:MAG: HNH endonuclease [Gammaproteobacteria bacterium]
MPCAAKEHSGGVGASSSVVHQRAESRPFAHLYRKHRWRKASEQFRRENPLCKLCQEHGVTRRSQVVDHIVAHKGDLVLFWDRGNWQALCKKHHDHKTATQDSNFASGVGGQKL